MVVEGYNIRDKATIRKIDIPADKLAAMQKVVESKTSEVAKEQALKRLLDGGSRCCVCAGIPRYEKVFDMDGATKIERYCDKCIKKDYSSYDTSNFILVESVADHERARLAS